MRFFTFQAAEKQVRARGLRPGDRPSEEARYFEYCDMCHFSFFLLSPKFRPLFLNKGGRSFPQGSALRHEPISVRQLVPAELRHGGRGAVHDAAVRRTGGDTAGGPGLLEGHRPQLTGCVRDPLVTTGTLMSSRSFRYR